MNLQVTWKVYEEEATRRDWVPMPEDIIGTPLFEHATDYITELDSGVRVMVRKSDSFVFDNGSYEKAATKEQVASMQQAALRRRQERDKTRVLRSSRVIY